MNTKSSILLTMLLLIISSCTSDDVSITNNSIDIVEINNTPNLGNNTYVIELEKFDIKLNTNYKDSLIARKNTEGINKALKYAKQEGYITVSFPQGQYSVMSERLLDRWSIAPNYSNANYLEGIIVPSDITLELNNAVFRLLPNNKYFYSVFYIHNVQNVTINGGHLIGDRHEHEYLSYENLNSDSHEWGSGYDIIGSKNITIRNTKVEQMTGDAIIVNAYNDIQTSKMTNVNENIMIENSELFDCRRQGISIVHGTDVVMRNNKIHKIYGTLPMCGIDVEAEAAYGCMAERIDIYDNHIYDVEGGFISCHTGDYINVFSNLLESKDKYISVVYSKNVKIYDNIIKGAGIWIHESNKDLVQYNNTIEP